jgi:hypothetical protein
LLLRERVGLVQRIRSAAQPARLRAPAPVPAPRRQATAPASGAAQRRFTATRLLELLNDWLAGSKLRLLDVFRSHALHARHSSGGGGGAAAADGDDTLDESEAVALFATGPGSAMQFEGVSEDDARDLVRARWGLGAGLVGAWWGLSQRSRRASVASFTRFFSVFLSPKCLPTTSLVPGRLLRPRRRHEAQLRRA